MLNRTLRSIRAHGGAEWQGIRSYFNRTQRTIGYGIRVGYGDPPRHPRRACGLRETRREDDVTGALYLCISLFLIFVRNDQSMCRCH